jgi:diguanylate cyclase (GGDEF)-like protein
MQLDIQGSGSKKVTVSIGVATSPQACQTAEDLVRSADRVLYLAKNNGRDRVEMAETVVAG